MFDLDLNDTLQPRLGHCGDLAASHMLAQQHTEIRSGEGTHFVFICKIDQGQGSAGRYEKPVLCPVVFYSEDQLVRLWLCDLVDLAAHNGII